MRQDNVRKVIFRRGEENRIVLEQGSFKYSLFQQQYLNALQSFLGICRSMSMNQEDDIANIISFCGDRGEGKSSCMRTTRKIFKGEDLFTFQGTNLNEQEKLYLSNAHELKKYPVYALEVIDPSFFDEEHNILDLVVSRLFQEAFRGEKQTQASKERFKERSELLSRFNRIKDSMSILEKKRREILDNIEDIDRLAESMLLRENLRRLFDEFLKYKCKRDGKEYKRLLICIDDLDLNITGGYTMLEQIRKYLSNEYCVILIALKIEQMTKVVQNALYEESGNNNEVVSVEMCLDMAEKYISKMFPTEHRVIMSKVDDIMNYRLQLQEFLDEESQSIQEWSSIKEAVVSLIFKKTRYLFYNTEHEVNRIIPRNLRSLRHLLATLLKMDDFEKGSLQSKENQNVFKRYFFNEWTTVLPEDQHTLVQDIIRYSDERTKNHYVLTSLLTTRLIGEDTESFGWFNTKVRSYNISVGDVLYVIQYLQETGHADLRDLLFFLQSYYSMSLYDSYDELVGEIYGTNEIPAIYDYKKYKWDGDYIVEKEQPITEHREIYANDERFRGVSKLQLMVGGAYYTYEPGELLPEESVDIIERYTKKRLYSSMPRDYRGLDANRIFGFMRNYIANFKINRVPTLLNENMLGFRLSEFIAITTKMTQTADESKNGTYRNRSYPYYLSTFKQGNTIVVFDVMAIFANIINLRFAYDRFNEVIWGVNNKEKSFFELALEQEGSLLNDLLKPYFEKAHMEGYEAPLRYAYAMGRLASAGIIRNVDVHRSLLAKVKAERESISKNTSSGSGYIGRIIDFYKTIWNSEITLYGDANVAYENLYTINYKKLLDPITSVLHEVSKNNNAVFEELFKSYEEVNNSPETAMPLLFGRQVRRINIPTLQDPMLMPSEMEGVDTSYLQAVYDEVKKFDWSKGLTGEYIKKHLSSKTHDAIPALIRKCITKRQKYISAEEFMKRLELLIEEHIVKRQ